MGGISGFISLLVQVPRFPPVSALQSYSAVFQDQTLCHLLSLAFVMVTPTLGVPGHSSGFKTGEVSPARPKSIFHEVISPLRNRICLLVDDVLILQFWFCEGSFLAWKIRKSYGNMVMPLLSPRTSCTGSLFHKLSDYLSRSLPFISLFHLFYFDL